MDSEFRCLLYHTKVRWLSRGKVLARLYKMKEEIMLFLTAKDKEKYADLFADDDWRAMLVYLADIFGHLNVINVSLQGLAATLLGPTDKLYAFREKLTLWQTQLEEGNVTLFPLFTLHLHYLMSDLTSHLMFPYVLPYLTLSHTLPYLTSNLSSLLTLLYHTSYLTSYLPLPYHTLCLTLPYLTIPYVLP